MDNALIELRESISEYKTVAKKWSENRLGDGAFP